MNMNTHNHNVFSGQGLFDLTRDTQTVIDECLESKARRELRKSYRAQLKCSLNTFSKSFKDRLISTIFPQEIEDWLYSMDVVNATRQGYLKDVRTLFSFAHRKGYTVTDAALLVDRPESENKSPGILSPDETEALMLACLEVDAGLSPWLAVQLFGGVRHSEACQLTSEEVTKDAIRIESKKSKTRRRRIIQCNATLKSWISGDYDTRNWRRRWWKVRDKAGIEWPSNCMRHSFCSYGVAEFGARATAEAAGHSEQVLFAHYRALVTPQDAKRYWAIMA